MGKRIEKNQYIENHCYNCSCKYAKVTSVSRNKISSDIIVWCRCVECDAPDDIITTEEDMDNAQISIKQVKEECDG